MSGNGLVIVEHSGAVAHVILNRPDALNALSSKLAKALLETLATLDQDDDVRCVVLRGSGKGFAAGAAIQEMSELSVSAAMQSDYFSEWDVIRRRKTPIIAAVHGFALGGGCELAMMCDIIIASSTSKFGQPEVKLGGMPGMGGTQRLTRLVGAAKAMDLVLTGRLISADEAEKIGLVSRVVDDEDLISTAEEVAQTIAAHSQPSIQFSREAVERAADMPLEEGLRFERRAFHSLFAGHDQQEGMAAFLEKRSPNFIHE